METPQTVVEAEVDLVVEKRVRLRLSTGEEFWLPQTAFPEPRSIKSGSPLRITLEQVQEDALGT